MRDIYVHAYNIEYTQKEKILHVSGPGALASFMATGNMNCYDHIGAPKQYDFKLRTNFGVEDLDQLEEQIKCYLTDELGLTVTKFNYSFREVM